MAGLPVLKSLLRMTSSRPENLLTNLPDLNAVLNYSPTSPPASLLTSSLIVWRGAETEAASLSLRRRISSVCTVEGSMPPLRRLGSVEPTRCSLEDAGPSAAKLRRAFDALALAEFITYI